MPRFFYLFFSFLSSPLPYAIFRSLLSSRHSLVSSTSRCSFNVSPSFVSFRFVSRRLFYESRYRHAIESHGWINLKGRASARCSRRSNCSPLRDCESLSGRTEIGFLFSRKTLTLNGFAFFEENISIFYLLRTILRMASRISSIEINQ